MPKASHRGIALEYGLPLGVEELEYWCLDLDFFVADKLVVLLDKLSQWFGQIC